MTDENTPQNQPALQEQPAPQEQPVLQTQPIPQEQTPTQEPAPQEQALPQESAKPAEVLPESKDTLPDGTQPQVQPQPTESFFAKNKLAIIGGVVGLILVTVGVGILLSLGNSSKLQGMLDKRLSEIQTEQSQSLLQNDLNQNSEIPFSQDTAGTQDGTQPQVTPDTTPKAPVIVPTE